MFTPWSGAWTPAAQHGPDSLSPPPLESQPFSLVSMGTKRQTPVLRRRQFPRQLATAGTGWG